jgi:RNA polymerase sigma-70 factor (ECF subfamily)
MRKNNERLLYNIFNDHGKDLFSYAYSRTRSVAAAEDIVQSAYLRIAEYKKDLAVKNMRSFAFTVVLNLLRDMSRRNATRLAKSSDSLDTHNNLEIDTIPQLTYAVEPSDALEAIEHIRALNNHLIKHLPRATLRAFYLHRVHGHSHKHIAKNMNVTISMVEKHVMQASKEVKRFRAKHDI